MHMSQHESPIQGAVHILDHKVDSDAVNLAVWPRPRICQRAVRHTGLEPDNPRSCLGRCNHSEVAHGLLGVNLQLKVLFVTEM